MRLTQIHRFPERLLSTVHRGTAFEYRALALLTKHMSMSLTRVGGSHDGGVDLIGWWWVPSENHTTRACRVSAPGAPLSSKPTPSDPLDATSEPMGCTITKRRRLRVIAQCKAEKRKMGPGYLRELEGVVYRHAAAVSGMSSSLHPASKPEPEPSSPRIPQALSTTGGDPTGTTTATAPRAQEPAPTPAPTPASPPVALLVSESAFTRNCLLAAHASPLPFLLVHLPSQSSSSTGSGTVGTVFGNPALVSAKGVLGGELEIRWEHGGGVPSSSSSGVLGSGRPRLWWQGQPLPSWTPDADHGVVLNHR